MKNSERAFPEVINLGDVPAGRPLQVTYPVTLPEQVSIASDIPQLAVSLAMRGASGQGVLTIDHPNPRQHTLIQGQITLTGPTLNAAIWVTGRVVSASATGSAPASPPLAAASPNAAATTQPASAAPAPFITPPHESRVTTHTDQNTIAPGSMAHKPERQVSLFSPAPAVAEESSTANSSAGAVPDVINLGDVPAGQPLHSTHNLTLHEHVSITSDSAELAVSLVMHGAPGRWLLTIDYLNPKPHTLIQGKLSLTGPTLNTSIWITGRVVASAEVPPPPQTQSLTTDGAEVVEAILQEAAPAAPLSPSAPPADKAEPLQHLRTALHTSNDSGALALLAGDPQLADYLLAAQQTALEQAKNRVGWVHAIRAALLNGDEAGALRLRDIPNAPLQRLRAGERAQLDWLGEKHTALPRLRQSMQQESDAATTDYWSALAAGVRIPAALNKKARAIRLRHSEQQRPATVYALPSFTLPSAPVNAAPRRTTSADATPANLTPDLPSSPLAEAGNGAGEVPVAEAFDPQAIGASPAGFEQQLHTQRRHATFAALRAALNSHDTVLAARLWAYARAHWPSSLDPEDDAAGQAAFRAWGASLRQRTTGA